MSEIEEISYLQHSIKLSRDSEGCIDKVCLNDVCASLKRDLFIKNGIATRKCPSATILEQCSTRDVYASLDEVAGFIKWISGGSKVIETPARNLLELLQKARVNIREKSMPVGDMPHNTQESGSQEMIALEYAGNKFTMRMSDGRYMVNATEMSRPYDKRPTVWLKLAETVKYRQSLVDDGIFPDTESQVITTRGPYGATWLEVHLWVQFAQWLSPAFASWCSKQLVPLMRDGHVSITKTPDGNKAKNSYGSGYADGFTADRNSFLPVPTNYDEALMLIEKQVDTIQQQRDFIENNKFKFEHYNETIESREWFSTTMIANELGISAIKLNLFLMDEGVQQRKREEWIITPPFRHLRDIHIYEWHNHKTNYTNKYKIDSWTPQGREYILDLWKKNNG